MTTWKATERAVAKILGGERVPITGRVRGSEPDIRHDWLSIEVKHRKELPKWMADSMEQAQMSKRGEQLPVVILHQSGERHDNDYVVVRLEDFVDWFVSPPSG